MGMSGYDLCSGWVVILWIFFRFCLESEVCNLTQYFTVVSWLSTLTRWPACVVLISILLVLNRNIFENESYQALHRYAQNICLWWLGHDIFYIFVIHGSNVGVHCEPFPSDQLFDPVFLFGCHGVFYQIFFYWKCFISNILWHKYIVSLSQHFQHIIIFFCFVIKN